MEKRNDSFKDYIKNNSVTVTIQLVGACVLVLNLWLANKLAPMAQDIRDITHRVEAVETNLEKRDEKIDAVPLVQQRVELIYEDITEIKQSLRRIEDRL